MSSVILPSEVSSSSWYLCLVKSRSAWAFSTSALRFLAMVYSCEKDSPESSCGSPAYPIERRAAAKRGVGMARNAALVVGRRGWELIPTGRPFGRWSHPRLLPQEAAAVDVEDRAG